VTTARALVHVNGRAIGVEVAAIHRALINIGATGKADSAVERGSSIITGIASAGALIRSSGSSRASGVRVRSTTSDGALINVDASTEFVVPRNKSRATVTDVAGAEAFIQVACITANGIDIITTIHGALINIDAAGMLSVTSQNRSAIITSRASARALVDASLKAAGKGVAAISGTLVQISTPAKAGIAYQRSGAVITGDASAETLVSNRGSAGSVNITATINDALVNITATGESLIAFEHSSTSGTGSASASALVRSADVISTSSRRTVARVQSALVYVSAAIKGVDSQVEDFSAVISGDASAGELIGSRTIGAQGLVGLAVSLVVGAEIDLLAASEGLVFIENLAASVADSSAVTNVLVWVRTVSADCQRAAGVSEAFVIVSTSREGRIASKSHGA
jgi:hypothetical protein